LIILIYSFKKPSQNNNIADEQIAQFKTILPMFCNQLQDLISVSMSYETDTEKTHIRIRQFVENNFKEQLSYDVMNSKYVKDYIIENVIRKYWHPLLEEFYNIITNQKSKNLFQILEIFNKKFDDFRLTIECKNASFIQTRAGKTFFMYTNMYIKK
jgi:hypothetical protein